MMLTTNNLNRHNALRLLHERVDFSNEALSIWKKAITCAVQTHNKPTYVTQALIILCEFMTQQPPCKVASPGYRKIASIIKHICSHQNPVSLAQAITLLKSENVELTEQESRQLTDALIQSPDPFALIIAIHQKINNDAIQYIGQPAPRHIPNHPQIAQQITRYGNMWVDPGSRGTRVTHTIQEDSRRRPRSKTEEEPNLVTDERARFHSI